MQLATNIKYNLRRIINCGLLTFLATGSAIASEPDILFRSDEVVKIELRSDFSKIIGDRTEFQEYQEAELIYYTDKKKPVSLQVMIMARGNFRRNPDNCSFPPLYLNFKKSEVKNTLFDNQDKIKLVTPCQGEEDLLEEYIIYKMYNEVTDMSLRARLVKVQYYDTGENRRLFEKYSFFLEEEERAARRVDADIAENKEYTPTELDRENFKKMSVFQYMIGNIDWNISSGKNIIIMQPEGHAGKPYAVPYDFDFSAFVDAKYTIPKGLPDDIRTSRKIFRGACFLPSEFYAIFDFYRKLRPSFESIINKQKDFTAGNKNQLLLFLGEFYSVINNEQLVKEVFLGNCDTLEYNITGGN
jgi:hypothetical protein